jgi:hypothetical protein
MQIGIALISNRPDRLRALAKTLPVLYDPTYEVTLAIAVNRPATLAIVEELRQSLTIPVYAYVDPREKGKYFDYLDARDRALALVRDDCHFIFWIDDDFIFREHSTPSKYVPKTSLIGMSSRIALQKALAHLITHPHCGVVVMNRSHNGHRTQGRIEPVRYFSFETAVGMLFRARDAYFHPEIKFQGAGEDIAFCLSRILAGQTVDRLYNSATNKEWSKKVGRSNDPNYNPEFIESNGLNYVLRERFGFQWIAKKRLPLRLWELHVAAGGGQRYRREDFR